LSDHNRGDRPSAIGLQPLRRFTSASITWRNGDCCRRRESDLISDERVQATMSRFEELAKRGFDIAVAITGLILLSPLLLLVTLAIKLESRGSALCRQPRYSLNGATIEVFRFSTTISDRAFNQLPIEMPRATRIGQVLRRTGIEKIPQLINVLRGEMSIVGPCLYATAPGKALRTARQGNAKPGVINWATIGSNWEKTGSVPRLLQHRIERDLYYIENRSFLFDIKIILLVFFSMNSYR
jgi:lipopolysaccharide/colanic/teichoic acid biosynthesis glycosyltransferase